MLSTMPIGPIHAYLPDTGTDHNRYMATECIRGWSGRRDLRVRPKGARKRDGGNGQPGVKRADIASWHPHLDYRLHSASNGVIKRWPSDHTQGTGKAADVSLYHAWRLCCAVPEGPGDLPADVVLPLHANLDLLGS